MTYAYPIYGLAICALFIYAINTGWNVIDPLGTVAQKPGGPGIYHK